MNGYKKITVLVCVFIIAFSIAACGQVKESEILKIEDIAVNPQESDMQTSEGTDAEIKEGETQNAEGAFANQPESSVQTVEDTDSETKGAATESAEEASVDQPENSAQAVENADSERIAEELLDLFINGEISAVYAADPASAFYISDLKMGSGEWDSYSVGERTDLDNDGENELVINGPYGGMYLDARDNKVYQFATGGGTAVILSYTYFNGAVWIMYSSRSSAGFEYYHMEKYEGADHLAAEINFGEELADPEHAEAGMKYTWNGDEISYEEYTALCSKILAAEVSTN